VPPLPELERADPNQRFRDRRAQARRRRRLRRTGSVAVLLVAAAVVALGATVIGTRVHGGSSSPAKPNAAKAKEKPKPKLPRPMPVEVRGVHVTMALGNKLDEYLAIPGLNTIELDVKEETGKVGFLMPARTLARRVGASQPYYKAGPAAAKVRAAGVYLIGRVVVFEDPALTSKRPELAIQRADGSVWTNDAGLGWANPYDKRVWDYNIEVAKAAVRAGFDEIQFDYVRFPSDGPIEEAVFPRQAKEPPGWTITRFVQYASSQLRPLGVRVSVDVFGLSATHELGIGQKPGRLAKYVDTVYPMVYPSHYNSGEFNLPDPSAAPGQTVAFSLRDFRNALLGRDAMLIPWLEDFSLSGGSRPPEDVWAQIRAARRFHTKGFLLWNPRGVYTEEVLK
jgi:Putative glycosyl hydrolase domain